MGDFEPPVGAQQLGCLARWSAEFPGLPEPLGGASETWSFQGENGGTDQKISGNYTRNAGLNGKIHEHKLIFRQLQENMVEGKGETSVAGNLVPEN